MFEGTEYEMKVLLSQLATLDEWKKGAEARLADPSIEPGGGMPEWESRASPRFVEAYKRQVAERLRRVEETLGMFEDDEP
jgi:hypothetical protein